MSNADPDSVADHYRKTLTPVRVDLLETGSKIDLHDRHYDAGTFSIWAGHCGTDIDVYPQHPMSGFFLYLPLGGSQKLWLGSRVVESAGSSGLITDAEHIARIRLQGGRSHIGIALGRDDVVNQLSSLLDGPVPEPLEFSPVFDIDRKAGVTLVSMARLILGGVQEDGGLRGSPLALDQLGKSIVALALQSFPHNMTTRLGREISAASPRHVKKAIDFMQAHAAEPLSVAEIAAACNISVRALQTGFQRFKNMTPMLYLRVVRLELAHAELMSGTAQGVATIAGKWGFAHPGRFSSEYRRRFGRLPSSKGRP